MSETKLPAPFARDSPTHEDYLLVAHYLADLLWQRGSGVEVITALTRMLETSNKPASSADPPSPGSDSKGRP